MTVASAGHAQASAADAHGPGVSPGAVSRMGPRGPSPTLTTGPSRLDTSSGTAADHDQGLIGPGDVPQIGT